MSKSLHVRLTHLNELVDPENIGKGTMKRVIGSDEVKVQTKELPLN